MEKWWSDGAKAFFLEYPTHPYTPAFGLSDTYLSQDDFRKKVAVERSFHNGYAVFHRFCNFSCHVLRPADCTVTTRDQTGIHTTWNKYSVG